MVSVTTTTFGAAASTLGRMLDERRGDDPLAPGLVVCSAPLVAVSVRRALGRRPSGIAGVAFTTLDALAGELAGPAMAAARRHRATELERQIAIRAELAERPGAFGRVAAHHTTEERLLRLDHQLGGVGEDVLATVQAAGLGLAGDAVRVLRGAQRRLSAWGRNELADAAIAALAELPHGARGPIVIYLPEPDDPFEGRLVRALAERSDTEVLVGLVGEHEIDRRHLGRLAGWSIQVPVPAIAALEPAARVEVADPDDEVRTALRDVAAQAAQGVPLSSLAVLYSTADPYAALLEDQLDRAGLPWCGPGHRPLGSSLTGRFVRRLLALRADGLEREPVIMLANSAPLRLDGEPIGDVAGWDRLSRLAGVVDASQWASRLGGLAASIDEPRRERCETLARFVADLGARLHPDPEPTTWQGWARWLRSVLDGYLGADDLDWPEWERGARTRVEALLDELATLDGAGGPAPDGDAFAAVILAQLDRQLAAGRPFGTGLFVAPVDQAVGLSFERVVVIGLAEGVFPRVARDDALLPDQVRAAAGGMIPAAEHRTARDVRAVAAALAGSNRAPLVISARGDLRSVRSRAWPRLLDGVVGPSTSVASHHRALVDHGRPASRTDFGLQALIEHVDGGDPVHTHELAERDQVVAVGLDRHGARQRGTLNPHVGLVPAVGLDLSDRLFSATALETYAACPRRYLFGRVLRLNEEERPERIDEITPIERGSLTHRVLERFVGDALTAGTVPEPGEPWPAAATDALQALLDEEIGLAQARGLTGGRVSTRILHRKLGLEMNQFLATDNALRAERRSTPVGVELEFGTTEDDPSLVSIGDGRAVKLRGFVDRVDRTEDGGVLVIDYKGGSDAAFQGMAADPLDGGRRLQLPLYARVMAERLGRDGPRTALYWLTRSGKVRPVELEDGLDEHLDRTVAAALDGITAGVFPGVPGEAVGWPKVTFSNCRYCEFDVVCPTDRHREWERLAVDETVVKLAPLFDLDEPDDGRNGDAAAAEIAGAAAVAEAQP
ncbi:MAG: PD-(D/E)XK nuclease family protein [Actinomycetota bacterium]